MDTGTSPFYAIQGLFCRGSYEELLAVEGRNAKSIIDFWSEIRARTKNAETKFTTLPSGTRVESASIDISDLNGLCSQTEFHHHIVREVFHRTKNCYVGLLSCQHPYAHDESPAFQVWLETFFLLETTLLPTQNQADQDGSTSCRTTESISALFEKTLRNIASNDEWHLGRDLFSRRVRDFVSSNRRIQMAVPAFPCKSPNMRKVGGSRPDMAERIALQTLHTFAQKVKNIYPPGVAIWIISDGHVFSDCIGVDDQMVMYYDDEIRTTYRTVYNSVEDQQCIRFRGLADMFFSNEDVSRTFSPSWAQKMKIDHPISSSHTHEAETARKIMMEGCQSSRSHFRMLISSQHPPTLSLYRGQARFMQEDLATPDFLAKSKKQKKKVSFDVAAEMIARNQAYSNLLEMLLPNYVRLSIHAHTNRGPKFGIRLFPQHSVRPIDSLSSRHELFPAYEFQIPSPWHNSIIKVIGDETLYLGKAEIVRAAIEKGDYQGGWVEGPDGGHFAIRCIAVTQTSTSTAGVPSSGLSKAYAEEKELAITETEVEEVIVEAPSQGQPKMRSIFKIHGKLCRKLHISSLRVFRRMIRLRESVANPA